MKICGALVVNTLQNGLGVIRALGELDPAWPIYAGNSQSFVAAGYSKFVSESIRFPRVTDDSFIPKLLEFGREKQSKDHKIVLIPTNDEFVTIFSENWAILSEYYHPLFITDSEILMACLHKTKSYELADIVDVPVPDRASTASEYLKKGGALPAVIKPNLRRTKEAIQNKVYRIAFCRDEKELHENAAILEKMNTTYVVQEYIEGGDDSLYTASFSCVNGRVLASFTGRKLRQHPPRTGIAAYTESLDCPKIVEYGKRLLEKIKYEGITQVEFKKRGDEYYLMEINPRSWAWVSLSTKCGVNLFAAWLKENGVEGLRYPARITQEQQQRYWIHAWPDLVHNVLKNKNISFMKYLKQLMGSDCKAYGSLRDPIPGFVEVFHSMTGAVKAVAKYAIRKVRR